MAEIEEEEVCHFVAEGVIIASQEKIRAIKENLQSCKNLLHCKRDELRKLWIEGIEHKTIVSMLDQMLLDTRHPGDIL